MAKRTTGQQILDGMSGGGGTNWREISVNLTPDPKTGRTVKKLRLVGLPIEFWEASARKRNADDPSKSTSFDFPDKAQNRAWTRICQDDLDNDYWAKEGFAITKRYAINCIDRDDGKVKVLARGKSIFEPFYQRERSNIEENIELAAEGEPLAWTRIGGDEAPDVKIEANKVENGWSNVEYTIHISNRTTKLTSDEIEKLRAAGCPTDEDMKRIRKANPDLADLPDYCFYGYDLEKLYAPTPPRHDTSGDATPADELEIEVNTEPEDDGFAEEPSTRRKSGGNQAKAPEKKEESDSGETEEIIEEVEW